MANTLAEHRVKIEPDVLRAFCERHHVRRLSLYGSVLRDDFRPDSDVDVMVEFDPDARPTLFTLGGMVADLEELIERRVDLKTPGFFAPMARKRVLATAEPIYVAD